MLWLRTDGWFMNESTEDDEIDASGAQRLQAHT